MNKSKKRPEQSHAPRLLTDNPRGAVGLDRLNRVALRLVPAIAAMTMAFGAHAQSSSQPQTVTIDRTDLPIPYILTAGPNVARGVSVKCIRSSTWSVETARRVTVKETGLPIGCLCEPEVLPREACSPPAPAAAAPAPAPAPAPAAPRPAAPAPAPVPSAEKVNIPSDALFAYDRAEISSTGRDKLMQFANSLKGINLEVITAVGHADRIGSDSYNQKLSEKRANSVKDFLIEQGVPANRIYTEGKGESQPVSGDKCRNLGAENKRNTRLIDCLAVDRRVELEAVGTRTPNR